MQYLIIDPNISFKHYLNLLSKNLLRKTYEAIIYFSPTDASTFDKIGIKYNRKISFEEILKDSNRNVDPDYAWNRLRIFYSQYQKAIYKNFNLLELNEVYFAPAISHIISRALLFQYIIDKTNSDASIHYVSNKDNFSASLQEFLLKNKIEFLFQNVELKNSFENTFKDNFLRKINAVLKILRNTFNFLFLILKITKRKRILFQDHRNTTPIVNKLVDSNHKGILIGSSASRTYKNILSIEPNLIKFLFLNLYKRKANNDYKEIIRNIKQDLINFIANDLNLPKELISGLSSVFINKTLNRIKIQLIDIVYYRYIFKKISPDIIILNNYLSFSQQLLIALARINNCKSIVVEHGVFNKIRYKNDIIYSDIYAAWGTLTKRLYIDDLNKSKIHVLGNALIPSTNKSPSDENSEQIVIATPYYPPALKNPTDEYFWSHLQNNFMGYEEYYFINDLINELYKLGYKIHLQVHPAHEIGFWKNCFKNKNISISQRDSIKNLIESDILIFSTSSIGLDALSLDLEIIQYNLFTNDIFEWIFTDYAKHNVAHYTESIEEILMCIKDIRGGKKIPNETKQKFLNDAFNYKGEESINHWKKLLNNT